jgi:outer membrane protein assembly factor BamB
MMARSAGNPQRTAAIYRTAVTASILAGVFCTIVCVQMVFARRETASADPVDSPQLAEMKLALQTDGRNEDIKTRIRSLDLELRQDYFTRLRRLTVGAYLLLGGIVVLAAGLKTAATCRDKLPMPQPRTDGGAEKRAKTLSRWAVASLAVVMGAAATVLPMMGRKLTPPRGEANGVWPRFRGPGGLGVSAYTNYPETFNGASGEGILWKTPIALAGKSSPIVWEDRVFVTGASQHRSEVYCFDAINGRLLWKKVVDNARPPEGSNIPEPMEDTGHAAPTPVTDGERICAIFATGNIACFDLFGKQLWLRKLGYPDNEYGHAASLAMDEGRVLVQIDQGFEDDDLSKLYALDVKTGKTVWEATRTIMSSWTSPIVIETPAGKQVITCANPWVIAYDLADGKELWRADCLEGDGGPSAIAAGGFVLAMNVDSMVAAIRPNGKGDVTETHIAWRGEDGLSDICSPVSNGKQIFLATAGGEVTCYNLADGEKLWTADLRIEMNTSPSLVGDRLWLIGVKGEVRILSAGAAFQEVGRASLGEKCDTCPAFVDGRVYIRGHKHLYCIGQK